MRALVFGVDPSETASVLAELAETGHTAAAIGSTSVDDSPGVTLR